LDAIGRTSPPTLPDAAEEERRCTIEVFVPPSVLSLVRRKSTFELIKNIVHPGEEIRRPFQS